MKKLFCVLCVGMFLFAALAGHNGAAFAEPDFAGRSGYIVDFATGTVVYAFNENERMPVASIVKVMTILLILERIEMGEISLKDVVTVSASAAGMGGSQVYLDFGGKYEVGELLKSIIVSSANDSSVAMAEEIAGLEESFVNLMNTRAFELGMNDTMFTNSTGLPSSAQYTTAADVSKMVIELLKYPLFFQYSRIINDEIEHNDGRITMLTNTNKLLTRFNGCDGVKTGFTNEAMFCLASTAKQGDTRFVVVGLGFNSSSHRFTTIEDMLIYAFSKYKTEVMIDMGEVAVQGIPVRFGEELDVDAIAAHDLSILIEQSDRAGYTTEVTIFPDITAPIILGDVIGRMDVIKSEEIIGTVELLSNRSIKRVGFFLLLTRLFGHFY